MLRGASKVGLHPSQSDTLDSCPGQGQPEGDDTGGVEVGWDFRNIVFLFSLKTPSGQRLLYMFVYVKSFLEACESNQA